MKMRRVTILQCSECGYEWAIVLNSDNDIVAGDLWCPVCGNSSIEIKSYDISGVSPSDICENIHFPVNE